MRPRTITAIILLIVIVLLGVYEQVFINNTFDELQAKAEILSKKLENTDSDTIREIDNIIEFWDKKSKKLELLTPHDTLDVVCIKLYEIKGYIEINDFSTALAMNYSLISTCEHVPHLLGFSLEHIC